MESVGMNVVSISTYPGKSDDFERDVSKANNCYDAKYVAVEVGLRLICVPETNIRSFTSFI